MTSSPCEEVEGFDDVSVGIEEPVGEAVDMDMVV